MAVIEMCDCDDHQGYGDGESYVVGVDGDGQGDGLGALRPLHCVYLFVLPHPSDAHLHLRTDIMLPSDGLPRKPRSAAESATPPRYSHTKTGMNRDVVGYGEEDEESNFVGFLYPADVFLELRDAGEETTETGMNRIVVRYGEGDAESTYVVNCVAFVHPADVFLELRDDTGELLGHVRFLSVSPNPTSDSERSSGA